MFILEKKALRVSCHKEKESKRDEFGEGTCRHTYSLPFPFWTNYLILQTITMFKIAF